MSLVKSKHHGALIGLEDDDHSAYLKKAAGDFNGFPLKASPVGADIVLLEDSADGFCKKKASITDVGGEANTASNIGASGQDVFHSKSGVDLRFRKVHTPSANLTIQVVGDYLLFTVVDAAIDHDALDHFVSDEHVDHTAITIIGATGLTGGGDLSANRTLTLDINGLVADGSPVGSTDYIATYDADAGTHKKVLLDDLPDIGEVNTASNQGSGTSIFYQKSGVDLQFNAVKSENDRISIALDGATHDVEITLVEANIVHDNISGGTAADAHHSESHSVASHSDTTATGAELEELTDGSETSLHSHAGGAAAPTGSVVAYGGDIAGDGAPAGWLYCNGSAVSRATYSDLFAVLSTRYGVGDGSTTFNLPNLKTRFPRGGCEPCTCLGDTGGGTDAADHTHPIGGSFCKNEHTHLLCAGCTEIAAEASEIQYAACGCGFQLTVQAYCCGRGETCQCWDHVHPMCQNVSREIPTGGVTCFPDVTGSCGSHSIINKYQNFHWIVKT